MARFLALLLALLALPAGAYTFTHDTTHISLEGQLDHYVDASNTQPVDVVRQQTFTRLPSFRSLGYGTQAHWFRFRVSRMADAPTRWVLAIGSPELEEVDIYVPQPDGSLKQYALGYHRPYADRPLQTRLFAVPFDVNGNTEVLFRVRTTNAINVQAEIWQPGAFVANETQVNFYRGTYFGILLIAVLLYVILGARLRDLTMVAYAGYIASQTLFNLGTNGYLPVLLTSLTEHAGWYTDALPRIGWLGGAISIVLMWDSLLGLKRHFPRVHRLYQFTVGLNLVLLPFALMPFLVTAPLLVVVKGANYLNVLNFFLSMGIVALFWWRSRRTELLLYFIAFVIPALGTLVNTAANQGMVSQNVITSNLYQVAPLIHVLVMSFGLALRLRQLQHDKAAAERAVLVATQRAEEQRRFVAMLSHEFYTPLAAIDRATQMVMLKSPELPAPESERLAQIRGNVATLSGFVDNFLMTESLEHGGLALLREPCAMRALLENAIRQQAQAERITLRMAPEEFSYALDPTFMSIAVGNLMANALRYAPPESPVEVSVSLDAQGLRIRVLDQGPGIGEEELARLGTPYYRASTSAGKKGSGLGFYFTQCIVEAHGGTLAARTRSEGGLEVEMVLPRVNLAGTALPASITR